MANKRKDIPDLTKLLANKRKRYVRYAEGAKLYSMGINTFRETAKEAHAVIKLRKIALVDLDVFDDYLENFRA